MWLEAILSREDLEQALRALTPATLTLGAHGSIAFGAPVAVTLVAGRGLRVVCPATVHGSVFHVDVPVHVASATVLLEPSIAPREGRPVLVFKVSVESVDVAALPHIIEDVAVGAINDALVSHDAELVWDFRRTLSHSFTLPDVLTPSRSIDLSAAWGELRITEAALVFAISVHTIVDAAGSLVPLARKPKVEALATRARPSSVGVALAGLAIGVLGLVAGRALGRRRPRAARYLR